ERFALNQFVEKLRLIPRSAIRRAIQKILSLLPRPVALRDFGPQLSNLGMIAAGVKPTRDRDGKQRQGHDRRSHQSRSPAHPELLRILVRLTGEIDIK